MQSQDTTAPAIETLQRLRHSGQIRAISLDLDDTLWPIWPTIAKAEGVLLQWLAQHAPVRPSTWAIRTRCAPCAMKS